MTCMNFGHFKGRFFKGLRRGTGKKQTNDSIGNGEPAPKVYTTAFVSFCSTIHNAHSNHPDADLKIWGNT
ncbi:uncharacterized protein Bfra_006621 [Botrytis fragariae]|uniref:Uncharacterized protein n=1 Tax=Botrytis fragariae TaxID=1964551 RepID=A0A8H6B5N0_9HELO|nr:uncharacterized protein Bfra_006621 [Botrytis fragariae]KAF5879412.1 hypothetical protein Bfra_006621 [Botrytis fragariae]